jgi:hypothetical protein
MAFLAPVFTSIGSFFGGTAAATGATVGFAAPALVAPTAAAAGAGAAGAGFSLGSTLSTLGTISSAFSSIAAGNAQAEAAEYNAKVAQMEASQRESALRNDARRQIGAIRSGISKSGVTFEGTPLLALAESAANAEIDALNARWTGAQESELYRRRAESSRQEGFLRAGSSLLGGFGRLMA